VQREANVPPHENQCLHRRHQYLVFAIALI
jgi:hypothetical protein